MTITSTINGKTSWLTRFPELTGLGESDQALLIDNSSVIDVPANTIVFGPGRKPDTLLLVLSGSVRVQHLSEKGREIVLYRVKAGQSCVLTTSCLLAHEEYTATGITESVVSAVTIPHSVFDTLLGQSASFRQFVFAAYSRRITELFMVIEDVAFQKMDIRVAQKLLELIDGGSTINVTHQQLAAEIGTAREVVSRQLSEFQRRDWISQSRGTIRLLDQAALARLVGQ